MFVVLLLLFFGGRSAEGSLGTKRKCELVWPSGKALGWLAEGPPFESASALLSLQKLWFVDTVL